MRNETATGLRSATACTARSISSLKSPMTSSSWLESRSGPSHRSRRGAKWRRTGRLEMLDLGPGAVTVAEHVAKALGDEQDPSGKPVVQHGVGRDGCPVENEVGRR